MAPTEPPAVEMDKFGAVCSCGGALVYDGHDNITGGSEYYRCSKSGLMYKKELWEPAPRVGGHRCL